MMNKKFTNPYIIYYPVISCDGMAFPVNCIVRNMQEEVNKGWCLHEDRLWRGNVSQLRMNISVNIFRVRVIVKGFFKTIFIMRRVKTIIHERRCGEHGGGRAHLDHVFDIVILHACAKRPRRQLEPTPGGQSHVRWGLHRVGRMQTLGKRYAMRDFSFVSIPTRDAAVHQNQMHQNHHKHMVYDLWVDGHGLNTYTFSCAGLAEQASTMPTCHLVSIVTLTWVP
jgi:hypothetical protein